jgi:glycosyltransferase involved in cell wall biosynthesis
LSERQRPLVSIVIPAYRAATFIRETLDSVFAQTYPNLEVILVNDGSPDTEQLEAEIRSYGDRLIYIRQENGGPAAARNTAIRAARGKYIAYLDSDDLYLPWHVTSLVQLLEQHSLDLVYCDSYIERDRVRVARAFEQQPQNLPITFEKLLTEGCAVTTSAVVASRQAILDAGLFDEQYRRCEDFDLWLRMCYRGARMDILPVVGIVHRMLPNGLASDGFLLKRAQIEIHKKVLATIPVSVEQKGLIQKLIGRIEGLCQLDLVKSYLREARYTEALAAAGRAATLLQDQRSRKVLVAVRIAPWITRRILLAQDARSARRKQREIAANVSNDNSLVQQSP